MKRENLPGRDYLLHRFWTRHLRLRHALVFYQISIIIFVCYILSKRVLDQVPEVYFVGNN